MSVIWQSLATTWHLSIKELRAIRVDRVMIVLIVYVFTLATWMVADAASTEIRGLKVAVVDEDQSPLSRRLAEVLQPPLFDPPQMLDPAAAAQAQAAGRAVLVLTIPPGFERDLRAGGAPQLMILADATAIAFAGNGTAYLQQLLSAEIAHALSPGPLASQGARLVFRNLYNPNLTALWFTSVMQLMNSVTILTLILSGSAMIREREHGTIEHALVMPVRPHEIALSKIIATGGVILLASVASLVLVIEGGMGVPVAGALWLYTLGAAIYVVAIAALGLVLASFTQNMGQYGLLVIPAIIVINLLSGGMTPLESMPDALRIAVQILSPAPHFVGFAQGVLYRGAGFGTVWPDLLAMAVMACLALAVVLARFRKVLAG